MTIDVVVFAVCWALGAVFRMWDASGWSLNTTLTMTIRISLRMFVHLVHCCSLMA